MTKSLHMTDEEFDGFVRQAHRIDQDNQRLKYWEEVLNKDFPPVEPDDERSE